MSLRLRLVLINTGIFLALLLALEAGARIFFPRDLKSVFNDPEVFTRGRPFVVPDPTRGFALAPGFEQGRYRVNSGGFRGPELPADLAARTIILTVGDSGTFGWGVDEADSYPSRLAELCRQQCRNELLVINGGVPSYTSAQVRLYLEELLPALAPRAVIVGVFWNDVLYSVLPSWLPEYLVLQQPAPWRQRLLRYSGLYRALTMDRPSPPGVRAVAVNQDAIALYLENLRALRVQCAASGADFLVLAPSFNEAAVPERIWKLRADDVVTAESMCAAVAAFRGALNGLAREGTTVVEHPLSGASSPGDAAFIDLMHPSPLGYRAIAAAVAAELAARGVCDSPGAR
jgi:lysophospholipase L1-like esterase